MKCGTPEELTNVRKFYLDVLGLKIYREWSDGMMIDTGNGLLEIFTNADGTHCLGAIRHLALLTDDVDEIVTKVKAAGFEVFIEPNDKVIASNPPYSIRMAFCYGPLGEQVEFYMER